MHHRRIGMAQPPRHLHIRHPRPQEVAGKAVPHPMGRDPLAALLHGRRQDLFPDLLRVESVTPMASAAPAGHLFLRDQEPACGLAAALQDAQQLLANGNRPSFPVLRRPAVHWNDVHQRLW